MEYPRVQSAGDHTMRYSATYLRPKKTHPPSRHFNKGVTREIEAVLHVVKCGDPSYWVKNLDTGFTENCFHALWNQVRKCPLTNPVSDNYLAWPLPQIEFVRTISQ